MAQPQPQMLQGIAKAGNKAPLSLGEPVKPILNVQGEVATMQGLIASRMSETVSPGLNTAPEMMEFAVSTVSRLSGYVFLAAAVAGIAALIF